ncbi:MAG TPA: TIM44-like domain-containing protein [Stellaceae bacterium]|nr:TIM44-like domain-containing protein [Stellaceae bacterium]
MSSRSLPQPLVQPLAQPLAGGIPKWRILEWRILLALFFCLTLALAPSLAEARAGSSSSGAGSSFGSRGTRTFENNGAAPLSRSMTQTPRATTPLAGTGAYGGSFFQRHPFLSGLAGGFLGSMLFGGMGGMGHVFGGLLTLLIVGGLVFFLFRLFAGGGSSFAGAGGGMPRSIGAAAAPAARFRGYDTTVGEVDLNAFQAIHGAVQEAWGQADLGQLRPLMTPEMLSYFSEELTRNTSQGVQNIVSNVTLLKGEVSESWEEGDLQFATAFLQWSAIDYVVRLGRAPGAPDYLVSGDPNRPVEAEEVWTFVRGRGGNWLLSAVQQV